MKKGTNRTNQKINNIMYSMTGFGSAEHATDALVARIEVSSINRKQSEVMINLPRNLYELDAQLRKRALKKISRGRLNVNIQIEQSTNTQSEINLDTEKVKSLKAELDRLSLELDQSLELTVADLLRIPEVFINNRNEISAEEALEAILPALDDALAALVKMREKEGNHLKTDIIERLEFLEEEAVEIQSHAPSVLTRYRKNLYKKLSDHGVEGLDLDLNDERIVKEIAIFAERCDIAEEITRLDSHFKSFRDYLQSDQPVGRSLDFLCQEINREFNTIGSKANDATLAQHVVNSKTELEKIREQVQNIE